MEPDIFQRQRLITDWEQQRLTRARVAIIGSDWLAGFCYLLSPFVVKFDIRVMTESSSTFFFTLTTYYLLKFISLKGDEGKNEDKTFTGQNQKSWSNSSQGVSSLFYATFTSGFCTLTRWYGLIFIPLLGWGYWCYLRNHSHKRVSIIHFFLPVIVFLPWLFFVLWYGLNGFSQSGMFKPPQDWKDLVTAWMTVLAV